MGCGWLPYKPPPSAGSREFRGGLSKALSGGQSTSGLAGSIRWTWGPAWLR